ncbi:unnamed protein product [Darwinula stevensoni]|uniref:FAD-binding FR-type domain-containing protein n=1 Tax=Darwinula stevensoni TaxID=69355 RepID=A0A7R8XAG6_9CRUS|nr:unnamed protein product [Darwinula stevensoni]CAG0883766.1 unnamed protein product [Darwinula stevensoni]
MSFLPHCKGFCLRGVNFNDDDDRQVTHLVIKRPAQFYFHPGDYVYVNIPDIAKYEWHPFTISSAPEQEGEVWLHVRGVGEWTNRLYEYFESEHQRLSRMNDPTEPSVSVCIECEGKKEENFILSIKRKLSRSKQENEANMIIKNQGFLDKSSSLATGVKEEDKAGIDGNGLTSIKGETEEGVKTAKTTTKGKGKGKSVKLVVDSEGNGNSSENLRRIGRPFFSKAIRTRSMPDVQLNIRKRQRLLLLREGKWSRSERRFKDSDMGRGQEEGFKTHLDPTKGGLERSFRYMRNKPTIVSLGIPQVVEEYEDLQDESGEERDIQMPSAEEPASMGNAGKRFHLPLGRPIKISLDGPFGAPSSHIFRAQHAVLIGTGIGVTPFASILQSIMIRYWHAKHTCPNCHHSWAGSIPNSVMNLRKVDFFWINREQRSFEWFVELLSQLEMEQAELGGTLERFLEMHMYITSALQVTDMKAVGLQLALDLLHRKEKRDLITGLKTRTLAGRPNWTKVFQQIAEQRKGRVTVFFCGPPALGRILRVKCDTFGFEFRKETF